MISGIDYVFSTNKTSYIFFKVFEHKLKEVWQNFISAYDTENGTLDIFYSKNKQLFDSMDKKGYT